MPILDMQRRGQQIGRIRIGQKVPTAKGYMRPEKLTTFRLTTGSRMNALAVAELLGGEVKEWERGQWEVITERSELMVTVPPRDNVISQWYEMWSKGGCQRRCDSVIEQLTKKPCVCPSDAIERTERAKMNPPQACKAVTRINVMIPDLPGLGVWRLDTGSFYAAVEISDSAELMEIARDRGVFLPAVLRIDQRERVANGKTNRYPVPVLEVTASFREIVSGAIAAGGFAAQLPPAPGEQRRAIAAAPSTAPAPQPRPAPQVEMKADVDAGLLAKRATAAVTRAELEQLIEQAKDLDVLEDMVCADVDTDTWEELRTVIRTRWQQLPPPAQPEQETEQPEPQAAADPEPEDAEIVDVDADPWDNIEVIEPGGAG